MNNNRDDEDDDDNNEDDINIEELVVAAAAQQQQQQPGNNVEVEDDHDHDEEEDEEEDDDGIDRDEDGVLDGGVASASNTADDSSTAAARRRSADCDLVLFITCAEDMDELSPNHPVLKKGEVVSIGLDKNTKLGAVFHRFAEFCNEHTSSPKGKLEESDLEFFHCTLLSRNDTAESSALMKNDHIKVRRERAAERETQTELKRIQRESDREYFKQLRHLLPDWGGSKCCDLILDCQGTDADESGRNQQVLSTYVRGNSVVLSKRCKWLGGFIQTAREERENRRVITVPTLNAVINGASDDEDAEEDQGGRSPQSQSFPVIPEGNIVANTSSTLPDDNENEDARPSGNRDDMDDEDDDDIGVLAYPVPQNQPQDAVHRSGATEIENDDDNDDDGGSSNDDSIGPPDAKRQRKSRSPSAVARTANARQNDDPNHLIVTLPNHSPDAVKLLLEYCYTNRVIPLGHEAFVQACRTKPVKPNGPVAPYSSSRRWPNSGLAQVSFSVAVAGIALAEEAGMHRLSLMCEVAASQLVSNANVTEALTMCTQQNKLTGNPLSRLRQVAIGIVLRVGPRGIYDTPAFRRALEERSTSIIPTLFSGTMEAIAKDEKQQKGESKYPGIRSKMLGKRRHNGAAITQSYIDECDREDVWKRERERRIHRQERYEKNPDLAALLNQDDDEGDVLCDQVLSSSWAAESARRSLKRMAPHLNVSSFHVDRNGVYASRENFGNRVGYGMARKRSSLRRSSGRS